MGLKALLIALLNQLLSRKSQYRSRYPILFPHRNQVEEEALRDENSQALLIAKFTNKSKSKKSDHQI